MTLSRGKLLCLMAGNLYAPTKDWRFADAGILSSEFTFTRAGSATYLDSAGVRQIALTNVPRFDHTTAGVPRGLLIEAAVTNNLLNSTSPATQTTASLGTGTYTIWCEGSGSATVAGNTATITGAGTATAGSPVTFVVTVAGTVDVTVAGSLTVFQLELGSLPTSLIITAGTTVTRAQDVCNIPTMPGWFNQAEGTWFIDWMPNSVAANALSADDGTANNRERIQMSTTTPFAGVDVGGVSQASFTGSGITVGSTRVRAALAYKTNDFEFTVNGAQLGTDTAGTLPTPTKLNLGANATGSAHNGWYRRLGYWNRRLPSARLLYETGL